MKSSDGKQRSLREMEENPYQAPVDASQVPLALTIAKVLLRRFVVALCKATVITAIAFPFMVALAPRVDCGEITVLISLIVFLVCFAYSWQGRSGEVSGDRHDSGREQDAEEQLAK